MNEFDVKKISGKDDEPTASGEATKSTSGDSLGLETKTKKTKGGKVSNASFETVNPTHSKASRQMPRRRRRARSAREVFAENEVLAATVIVEMMMSESSSNSLKVDCAKEVLTRLHGKAFEEVTAADFCSIIPSDLLEFCD